MWTGLTAVVMFALAAGKARTGAALGNPVLATPRPASGIDLITVAEMLGHACLDTVPACTRPTAEQP